MNSRVGVGLVAAALALIAGCASTDQSTKGAQVTGLLAAGPQAYQSTAAHSPGGRHGTLLHPTKKYFGVSAIGVPQSVGPLQTLGHQLSKEPNMAEWYTDWTHPFDVGEAQGLCNEGVVPVWSWESWDWSVISDGAVARSQPAYAPRRIAAGAYDSYIKSTAQEIKTLHCQLVLRFDHEMNGHWYPWGVATAGMHNTTGQYVAMWRHVWRIFHRQGVTNVKWMWSPNLLYKGGVDKLGALYPGNSYVDLVGMDGYLIPAGRSASSVFNPIMAKLRRVAPSKPWIVAETGVAQGSGQPGGISRLLKMVRTNKKLIGLIYLNEAERRSDWRFTQTRASRHAMRIALAFPAYGHAPAGVV